MGSPPNTVHTVYADRTIGLTITAWPTSGSVANPSSWEVHFRKENQYSTTLNETAKWYPSAGRWCNQCWNPSMPRGARLVPSAALAAVEAWLAEQALGGGAVSAPTPEPAPVATDEELADCIADAAKAAILNRRNYDKALTPADVFKAQIRAIYDLGRQHGAAQPAPPAPEVGEVGELVDVGEGRWSEGVTLPAPEVFSAEAKELVAALKEPGDPFPEYRTITSEQADRIAALLQQQEHLWGLAGAELDRTGAFSAAALRAATDHEAWLRGRPVGEAETTTTTEAT